MEDSQIIKLVLKDKEQYGLVVEKYERKLKNYIACLINRNDEEVEDILQDVFVSAFVKLRSYDFKFSFSSWMYRIAHNKAVDFMKKKRISKTGMEHEDVYEDSKAKLLEDLEIEKERNFEIREAMEKIDIKDREILVLYYFEERTYIEIADILKIPVNRVGVNLHRAKKKLEVYLKDEYKKDNK